MTPRNDEPTVQLGPGATVYVRDDDHRPVYEIIAQDADTAFEAAVAAERMGFGWAMSSYWCAEVDGSASETREYRLIAWRNLVSDTGPFSAAEKAIEEDATE